MFEITILLDTIDKIKEFVSITSGFDADFDLKSGRYLVDGKSIMGIFALDTSKPHELRVNCADSDAEKIKSALLEFCM